MVFFRRIVSGDAAESDGDLPLQDQHLEPLERIPAELRSEQGLDYLRLLAQLANCGLDAAGPPLLTPAPR